MAKNAGEIKRKKIGLALGGGASKGLAHIGVIKVLEKYGIPIDFIAGTSAGALVGGWYALHGEIDSFYPVLEEVKEKGDSILSELVKHSGLSKKESALHILRKYIDGKRIENCAIPFAAVATDLKTGAAVTISEGDMISALEASAAIPIVFPSVSREGRDLIDGGFVNPVPADIVRKMGADIVIAVDVSTHWFDISAFSAQGLRWSNIHAIFDAMLSVMAHQIAAEILKSADVVIRPPVLHYRWFDFRRPSEIIRAGANETSEKIDEILRVLDLPPRKKDLLEDFWEFVFGIKD